MIGKRGMVITIVLMVVLGTCMHFVHEAIPLSGPASVIVNDVFPVNETSWEHMKMIWYPSLVAGIILSIITKRKGYFSAFVSCAIPAMLIQLGVFSVYESFTGSSVLILDIFFYFACMVCFAVLAFDLAEKDWAEKRAPLWIVVAILVTAGIIYLTYFPGPGYVFLDDEGLEAN